MEFNLRRDIERQVVYARVDWVGIRTIVGSVQEPKEVAQQRGRLGYDDWNNIIQIGHPTLVLSKGSVRPIASRRQRRTPPSSTRPIVTAALELHQKVFPTHLDHQLSDWTMAFTTRVGGNWMALEQGWMMCKAQKYCSNNRSRVALIVHGDRPGRGRFPSLERGQRVQDDVLGIESTIWNVMGPTGRACTNCPDMFHMCAIPTCSLFSFAS